MTNIPIYPYGKSIGVTGLYEKAGGRMTREEAILLLHNMKDTYDEIHENTNYEIGYEQMTALDMAIEALQADAIQEAVPTVVRVSMSDGSQYYLEHERDAIQADAVQGYAEWLEKIIVDAETLEWLCEDTPCKEWCDENCHYKSIQAECLRHLYEVSKGGDSE